MSGQPSRGAAPGGPRRGARPAFTIVELLVALTIFAVATTAILRFFSSQRSAITHSSGRANATQNLRYAMAALGRDLRTAGTDVPAQQPALVYAGDSVVAFSADYATNVSGDPFAVYYDPDAPAGTVSALKRADRMRIPETSMFFPDTSYRAGATNSPAELLVFYFAADTTTARADDYVLYRQVNDAAPEEVARNLLRSNGRAFFQYLRLKASADSLVVDSVRASSLPLTHRASIHAAPGDTGSFATIDSVRAVRIDVASTNGETGDAERRQDLAYTVWMRNLGQAPQTMCGSAPIFGSAVTATAATQDGKPVIEVQWSAATDESGGEKDIIRYVVWRRVVGGSDGDPFLSIPAGLSLYTYDDATVQSGTSYVYSVAAQDCTPAISSIVESSAVTVP